MNKKDGGKHEIAKKVLLLDIKKHWFLFKLKYPKILLLLALIILAYAVFQNSAFDNYLTSFHEFTYLAIFIAGALYSFGFTAPFAVGYFVILNPPNLFLAALVGGIGSGIADLLIFGFIRLSFQDEFDKLKREHVVESVRNSIYHFVDENKFLRKLSHAVLYAIAIMIMGSPLPDEIGISMLAGMTHIKVHTLAIISFIVSTIGIYIILMI